MRSRNLFASVGFASDTETVCEGEVSQGCSKQHTTYDFDIVMSFGGAFGLSFGRVQTWPHTSQR